MLMSACVEENLEKGTPEHEGCMGVYFVEQQENVKAHTLEKGKDDKTLEFIVRRVNTQTEAYVDFSVEAYTIEKEEATDAKRELVRRAEAAEKVLPFENAMEQANLKWNAALSRIRDLERERDRLKEH